MTFAAARLAAALVWAIPTAASADPITQTVEEHRNDLGEVDRRGDDFVHRISGYVFPSKLGEMPARKTTTYGPANVSLYYTLMGGGRGDAWLSLYVYRAEVPLNDEVAAVEAALKQNFPDAVEVRPVGLPMAPQGALERWYEATLQGTAVTTGYRLVRAGDWYIKARLSIPKSGGSEAIDRAWRALDSIRWSVPVSLPNGRTAYNAQLSRACA